MSVKIKGAVNLSSDSLIFCEQNRSSDEKVSNKVKLMYIFHYSDTLWLKQQLNQRNYQLKMTQWLKNNLQNNWRTILHISSVKISSTRNSIAKKKHKTFSMIYGILNDNIIYCFIIKENIPAKTPSWNPPPTK